jgi:hypothetical protein
VLKQIGGELKEEGMQAVIGALLRELLKKLDQDTVKEVIDTVLDKIEDKVAATPNKWDDAAIQPIIDTLRRLADIDDKKFGTDK